MERRALEKGEKRKRNVSARRPFYYVSRFARLSFRFFPGGALLARIHLGSFASSILAIRSRISKSR